MRTSDKMTKTKTTPSPKTLDALLASTSLTQIELHELESTATKLQQVSRRSTEQVFELGRHLERASEILEDNLWTKWVKMRCGYTARNAALYRAVHRNLKVHMDILVELAVGATVLGKLGSAEQYQIEAAINFAKEQGHLRVSDVSAILKGEGGEDKTTETADPFNFGGVDGLKALIALKIREGLKSFIAHCEEIQADVLIALAGTRIIKKDLGQQTFLTARLARKELESLVQFVAPNPYDDRVVWSTSIPNHTHWKRVADLLHQMGNVDAWPDAKVLREWLDREIIPALAWATSKSKNPDWLLADPATKPVPAPVSVEADAPAVPTVEVADQSMVGSDADDDADDGNAAADEVGAVEVDDLAKYEDLEAAIERLRPAGKLLGFSMSSAKPRDVSSKRSKVAPPPIAPDAVESVDKEFKKPAFLEKKQSLALADLPSVEEATNQTDAPKL